MEAAKLQSCSGVHGCGNGVMAMGTASRSERDLEWVAGTLVLESAWEVGVSTLLLAPNFQAKMSSQKGEAGLLEERVLGKSKLNFLPPGRKGVKRPLSGR